MQKYVHYIQVAFKKWDRRYMIISITHNSISKLALAPKKQAGSNLFQH